jgi:(2Fe-2S) ferredoxin
MAKYETLADGLAAAKIDGARHHLFLCLGPDCAPLAEGEVVWGTLKALCAASSVPVMRTKAGCFRICTGGPWLLVYPEGVWYGAVTPERCERILREHIGQGKPVEEWIVKTHPLEGSAAPVTPS